MRELWQRVEKWISDNELQEFVVLNQGASEAEIAEAEKLFGAAFPPDVRESYLIHDGQDSASAGLIDGRELLSLARMRDEWTVWKQLFDAHTFEESRGETTSLKVKKDWWNPKWIPLTYDGSGNHDCLDFAPTAAGDYGQIIGMWHDDGERYLVASGWREWLEEIVSDLEQGNLVFSPDHFGVIDADDLDD